MALRRWDVGTTGKPELLGNGWLRVPARLTRTGVFLYRNPDGTTRRELRHPDEVFHPDSLRTLEMVPSTFDHPPVPLDAKNTKEYAVGHVGDKIVVEDSRFVAASMMITDGPTVERVMVGGPNETSCGYLCEVVDEAGVYQGEAYDGKQVKIRYNHVAIVREGRAGPDVRLKLDGGCAVMVQGESRIVPPEETKPMALKVVKIDGIEAEVSDTAAALLDKQQTKHAEALKEAQTVATAAAAEADKQRARADAAVSDKEKADKLLKEAQDPTRFQAAVQGRVALERTATAILGEKVKLDSMSDRDIKVAVVEKVQKRTEVAKKTDAYIDAAFELATEKAEKEGNSALRETRKRLDENEQRRRDDEVEHEDDGAEVLSYEAARAKFCKDSQNAWKKPLSGGSAQ